VPTELTHASNITHMKTQCGLKVTRAKRDIKHIDYWQCFRLATKCHNGFAAPFSIC
jgi:hypothetical protein